MTNSFFFSYFSFFKKKHKTLKRSVTVLLRESHSSEDWCHSRSDQAVVLPIAVKELKKPSIRCCGSTLRSFMAPRQYL